MTRAEKSVPQNDPKAADLPMGQIGMVLTAGYLCFLGAITKSRWDTLTNLPLNEVGDFLAGAFGPIAIFWLILGFFQQGKELGLQVEELRHSVAQQQLSAEASRRQSDTATQLLLMEIAQRKEAETLAQPAFRGGATQISVGTAEINCQVTLLNAGSSCYDLIIESQQIAKIYPVTQAQLLHGSKLQLHWAVHAEPGQTAFPPSDLLIRYRDAQGRSGAARISLAYGLTTRKVKLNPRYTRGTLTPAVSLDGDDDL